MIETHDAKEMIFGIIQHDPLFAVIRDTPLEEVLYRDPYLSDISEKKYYSTAEVSSWFDITERKLRYYIKPFELYIFDDTKVNSKTTTAIRLNLPAILKLRMILLLKDEHRVNGLKLLLGMDEYGRFIDQQLAATTDIAPSNELANKVDMLGNVLQQMMQTGLFNLEQEDESGTLQIALNKDFLTQNMLVQASESNNQIIEIQKETNKLKYENERLQKQITELKEVNAKDVVIKVRERFIENEIASALRTEALQQFSTQKKSGFFAKYFRSSQIELEKEQFVEDYISKHLTNRLEVALIEYYE
ncbi:hypothetical protein AEA09_12140 [Lysinibacillus contaminans]|uniref:Uncharacterized protein n=1 Tax=Lysinibacillus contaminans TaxID=1293441 RepID=A0ABR5K3I2_9BACI|nr:hypothetical protein [Lysinibacillus contaminans]KOS69225.1 hypothetical protein AEA09_12140 [Lysinibacillus contaminans]